MLDSIALDEPSSSTVYVDGGGGGRAIDRHNPIIRDEKRLSQGRSFPSSPAITINSPTTTKKPHHHHLRRQKPEVDGDDKKKKGVAFFFNNDEFIKRGNFISPASSSRCLLGDKATFDFSSEFHHVSPPSPTPEPLSPRKHLISHNEKTSKKEDAYLVSSPPSLPPPSPRPWDVMRFLDDDLLSSPPPSSPPQSPPLEPMKSKASSMKHQDSLSSSTPKRPSPPQSPPPCPSTDKVVVLEVSLHCRGCERKMKKHISKIEGVTSFKIEFAAKKVTVVGDVTPLAVLTSVLKVKNAKLLTPATISSPSSQTVS
nr:protein sodium potassium root defective 1-like [Tanacetum cinerariifolium]